MLAARHLNHYGAPVTAAVERWQRGGVSANPRAWLVSTGRFKAIDATLRRARHDASLADGLAFRSAGG